LEIEAQVCGILQQILGLEGVLVFIESVMHFPESALLSGRFRRFRREFRMGMNCREREIPENETELIAYPVQKLRCYQMRLSTEWALVIPIFDKSHGRVRRPTDVIPRSNGEKKFWRKAAKHNYLLCRFPAVEALAVRPTVLGGLSCAAVGIDDEHSRRAIMESFVRLRRLFK
jgi:hypothetical protein